MRWRTAAVGVWQLLKLLAERNYVPLDLLENRASSVERKELKPLHIQLTTLAAGGASRPRQGGFSS
jgi:hypothetical protein